MVPVFHKGGAEILIEPGGQGIQVERIGIEPVDGREMALIGKRSIQSPEDLHDSHGSLGNRLGKVSAGGRHSANSRETSLAFIAAQTLHQSCPLVELGKAGGKVSRITFLTGHLLQSAGHLTQGLRPAGGRVGDDGHIVTHVPEILGNGDAGINGSLTGGNRHIGGIGDEDRALHQGFPGTGVLQLRELPENICHFVAALAAADVDHDIHIRPLGKLVLHHCLSRTEGTGDCRRAALGHGEHGVDGALTCGKRPAGRIFFHIGPSHTDRPLLHHGQRHLPALGRHQHRHLVLYRKGTAADGLNGAAELGRNHDLMKDGSRFLDGTDHIAAGDLGALADRCRKVPLLLPVQGGDLHAPGDIGSGLLPDLLQGTLDTVVNVFNNAGAQLHAHGRTGGLHHCAGAKAGSLLIDLDGGRVTLHGEDLADQALGSYTDHVRHIGIGQAGGYHQRAGYLHNFTAQSVSLLPWNKFRVPSLGRLYVGADGTLNGTFDVALSDAQTPLPTGNEDDGGTKLILIAPQGIGHILCKLLRQVDHRAFFLGKAAYRLLCLLGIFHGNRLQSQGAKAQDGVPVPYHRNAVRHGVAPFLSFSAGRE